LVRMSEPSNKGANDVKFKTFFCIRWLRGY